MLLLLALFLAASQIDALEQSLALADRALQAGNAAEAEARYIAIAKDGEARLRSLPAAGNDAARGRLTATITAACFNLGILAARRSEFGPAATWLARAADLTPGYPNVQFALGTAYFNGGAYAKAIDPLQRVLTSDRGNASARRMLALARFNTESYEETVTLLRDDPQRDADPSLAYVYGVALVRSDRAAEAATAFSRLLESHRDSAPLNVVLGMAYAEQGDHDAAIQALKRALAIDPQVREANATLGLLYFKQGQLPEAESSLRAELKSHPDDIRTAHLLATVLDLDGKQEEAVMLLRTVIAARPGHANARYLLGKILLAQGRAAEAVELVDAAARCS